jgi:hypothetical protein
MGAAKKKLTAPIGFTTVKVRISTRTRLQDLLSLISQGGWSAVDDERREPPTLSSIVDAAVEAYWSRRT